MPKSEDDPPLVVRKLMDFEQPYVSMKNLKKQHQIQVTVVLAACRLMLCQSYGRPIGIQHSTKPFSMTKLL